MSRDTLLAGEDTVAWRQTGIIAGRNPLCSILFKSLIFKVNKTFKFSLVWKITLNVFFFVTGTARRAVLRSSHNFHLAYSPWQHTQCAVTAS